MSSKKTLPEFGSLSGIKVLVSGIAYAGPFAAGLMADYGADVITMESSMAPDMIRTGSVFQQMHRNELGIALNVPTPEGKEIFLKMIKERDIFIENAKAGQWSKWGLSDEELWKVNPKLIIAHASGYGQTGLPEYTSRGSWDAIGQAFGGLMYMNGTPEPGAPLISNPFICDYYTAIYTSWACLAAYIKMLKTGKGESIDMAQYEALVYSMGDAIMQKLNRGLDFKRSGEKNHKFAAWKSYKCKDGEIYCAPAGVSAMKKGLPFLGIQAGTPDIPEDWQFMPQGSNGGKLLEEKLAAYCALHTVEEADKELNSVGILATIIMTHDRMESHPHYKARNVITEWENSDGQMIKGPDTLIRFKNNPGKIWKGAPSYGGDNETILQSLGYTEAQIKELYAKKIITNDK